MDTDFSGCDVFTLNHDLLIEAVLSREGVETIDGFGQPDGDVAWWQPDAFALPSRTFFLKLHGSVNWLPHIGGCHWLTLRRQYGIS